ncbi:hypothetical protein JCM10207_008229 [Rhodosporidiobolus poonsookiae]
MQQYPQQPPQAYGGGNGYYGPPQGGPPMGGPQMGGGYGYGQQPPMMVQQAPPRGDDGNCCAAFCGGLLCFN